MDFGYVLLCCAHKGDGHSQSIRCFTVEFVLSVRVRTFIPILIAIVIALPVAWFSMNAWLSHYAFRTELTWFLASGGVDSADFVLTVAADHYSDREAGALVAI